MSSIKANTYHNNGREIKRPTLLPHSFTRWSKEYLIEAVRDFGDAGEALRLGNHVTWRTQTYHESVTGNDSGVTSHDLDSVKGIQREELKLRMKQFIDRQTLYERSLKTLYADILQHLSIESMNLLTKDSETYEACERSQDPLKLWTALQTSHSQVGRKVSDEEQRIKRLKLESLKQWDKKKRQCLFTGRP